MKRVAIDGPARRRQGQVAVALALAALALVASGCGAGDDSAAVPIPDVCLQSWNSESEPLNFGRHVYDSHTAKQAQVVLLAPSKASTAAGPEACAVVFVVPESDLEYGDVGMIVTRFGWATLSEIAPGDQGRLDQIQRNAAAAPNANLFPDGSLEPI